MSRKKRFTVLQSKRAVWVFLIIFGLLGISPLCYGAAQPAKPTVLTLEQVLKIGIDQNEALRNNSDKLVSKRLEVKTLIDQQTKALDTLDMSRLTMEKWQEDKTLTAVLERQAVIESLNQEILQLSLEIDKGVADASQNLRQLYFNILIQQTEINFESERIATLEPRVQKGTTQYQLGLVSKNDVTPQKDALQQAKEGLLKAQTLLGIYSEDLGKKIGIELLEGVSLVAPKPNAVGNDKWFSALLKRLSSDNLDLKKASLAAQLANRDFEALLTMSKTIYGGGANELETMSKQSKVDYKVFFNSYVKMLSMPKLTTEETYPLSVGAYRIDIPLTLLKTSLKPMEYTQKERYPLQYALNDRDMKREAYDSLLKQSLLRYSQIQGDLQSRVKKQSDNEATLKALNLQLEDKLKKSLLGEEVYSQVLTLKDQIAALKHDQDLLGLEIQKSLADLEQLVPNAVFKTVATELSEKIKPVAVTSPQWVIDMSMDHFTWQFSLQLPTNSKYVSYELSRNGVPITGKIPVAEKVILGPDALLVDAKTSALVNITYSLKLMDASGQVSEKTFDAKSAYGQLSSQ